MANNSEGIMARYKKYLTNQQKKKLRSLYAGYQQTTADERREAYLQARKAADRSAAAASAMGLGGGYEARRQAAADAELDKYGLQLNRQADAAFESNAVVPMANQTIKAQNEAARKAYERKRKAAQRAYQDALNKQAQQQTARLTKQERDRLKYYRYGQQYMDDALMPDNAAYQNAPKTTQTANPRSNTHNRDKAYQYAQDWVDEAGATRPKTKRERDRAKANRYAQDWAGNAPKESPLKKGNGSAVNPKFDISPKQPVVLPPEYAKEVEARVKDIAPNDVPQVKLDYLNEVNQYANLLQGLNEAYKPVGKMQDLANQYQQLVRDIGDPTLSVAQRKQASVLAQQLEQEYREAYNSFNANKAGLQYLQNRVEKAYGTLQIDRAVLSRLGVEMTEDDIGFNTGWAKTHGYIPETPEELFIATRDLIDNETETTDEFWKRAKNNSAVLFGYGDENGNYKNALGESTIPEEERKLVLDSQDEAWMRKNGFGWVIDGVAQMLENSNQYATFAQAAKAFLEQKEADEWQYFEERNVRRVLNRFNEIDDSEKETVMSEGAKQTGIDLDRWDDIHARWEGVSNYKFETDEDGQVHAVWKKTGNVLKDNALNRNAGNYMGGNIAAGQIEKKLGLPSRYLNANTLAIMTKEDAAFLDYCYGMGDKETARQYIYQLAELANQLVGKEKADKIAELPWGIRFAREAMDQFSYGVSSFHTGLADVFTDHRTPTTVKEVKSSAITENQRERGWGGAADVINPALVSAGNMAPSVALGYAGGAAAAALSNTAAGASTLGVLATEGLSHAGTISMGLSAGGKAKQEALRMGYGKDAANVYGIINGISETCLQEFMGGVVTLGQPQWLEALGDSILNSVKNPVARVMVRQALNAASETTEEVMQDILDPVFKGVSLDEKYLNDHPDAKQLLNTALSTVISTLLMNGMGGDMLNTAKTETVVQRLSESYGLSVADARFMLNTYNDFMSRKGGDLDIEDYNKFNELASVIESNLPASVIDKIQKGETDLISYGASRYGAESGKLDRNIAKLSEGKQTETLDATDHTAELANLKGKAKARYLIDASPTGKVGDLYFTTVDGKAMDVKNMGLTQKTNFNIAQKLAKAFPNIKIVAHDNLYGIDGVNHVVEGKAPEIHVSLSGSAMVMTTAAHELLHQVEKTDAKAYKNIQSYLTTLLDESEIATTEKNVASKYGIEYTVDEKGNKVFKDEKTQKIFESEVAAHLVEKVLTDDSFLDRVIRDSDPKNRTARAKLINGLKDVIDRVTKALRGEPTVSGKLYKLQRTIEKAYREMSKADLTATKTETEEADFEAVEKNEAKKEEAVKEATEKVEEMPTIEEASTEEIEKNPGISFLGNRDTLGKTMDKNMEPMFRVSDWNADEDAYREMATRFNLFGSKAKTDEFFNMMRRIADNISRQTVDYYDDNGNLVKGVKSLDYSISEDESMSDFHPEDWYDGDERTYSPVKPNSDPLYKWSIDFSTLCRKRLLQQAVQKRLEAQLKRNLSVDEQIAIRNALKNLQNEGKKIEVACALCYVEAARFRSPKQISRFMSDRQGFLLKQIQDKALADEFKAVREEVKEKYGVSDMKALRKNAKAKAEFADRIDELRDNYKPTAKEQALLDAVNDYDVTDFTTPAGLEKLARENRELYDAYTTFIRQATKSKALETSTPWRAGDSEKISDAEFQAFNSENGLRSNSWSDFQVMHLLDYISSIIELSTRNAKMQAYTKVANYARLMGDTGVMINLSLIPTAKYTEGSKMDNVSDYDPVEGMDYTLALQLRKEHANTVGTICIATNNEQLEALCANPNVDMVIPYHDSGMSKANRKKMGIPDWQSYQKVQSEKEVTLPKEAQTKDYHKPIKFSDWFDYDEAVKTAKNEGAFAAMEKAARKYLDLCKERGYTPKFADYTKVKGYWKLLTDRKMINQETGEIIKQEAVKPVFDEGTINSIIKEEVDNYAEFSKDFDAASDAVFEQFKDGNFKTTAADKRLADSVNNAYISAVMGDDMMRVSDTEYLSLAEKYRDGTATEEEKAELEKKVEEAAKKAGYTLSAYHGTGEFFTKFMRGYEGIHLGNEEQATQLANSRYENRSMETYYRWDEIKEAVERMPIEVRELLVMRAYAKSNEIANDEGITEFNGDINDAEEVTKYVGDIAERWKEESRSGTLYPSFYLPTFDRKVGRRLMHLYAKINSPLVVNGDIGYWAPSEIARMLLAKNEGKTEIELVTRNADITGTDIALTPYMQRTLRQLTEGSNMKREDEWKVLSNVFERLGYDGIKYLNTFEGDKNSWSYLAMNPSDVKSADPVTYDDNGDIIPLSERFNAEKEDIRYRISDYSEDETIVGTPIDAAAVRRAVKTGKEQTTKDGYTVKIDTDENNKYTVTVSKDGEVINTREGVANEELKGADIERTAAALMRNIKKGRANSNNTSTSDINKYFETGEAPAPQSDLAAFRYQSRNVDVDFFPTEKKERKYSTEGVNAQGRNYAARREADARLAERMHEGAIRARIERKANETEAEYKARIKKIYEDRYRREIKNTALKWNKKLVDMLARPTENKHVPVQLARSVAEFCEEVTKYLDGTTKRGEKVFDKIRKAYDRAFTDEQTILRAKSEDAGYDARGAVLNTSQKDEQLTEMLKELSDITAEKSFAELTRDEMDALLNVVRGVAYAVTDANKLIGEAEGKTVWQTGSTMIEQLENAPKVSSKLRGYLATSLDLRRLARIFSGSNENAEFVKLVEQLNQGAIEKERVAQELQSIFKPVTDKYGNEIKKWYGRKAEWIDAGVDKNGVIFKITKGMRVSLALHVLNESNMRHIERGGLTIPDAKLYAQGKLADAYANGKLVRLTAEQINDIIANMTEAEKAYVEAAKQLFHDRAGFYVNKTSLQLAGYTKANVENYFPIHTDKNFNKTDFASMSMDGSIEGQGFLKERVKASNPVYLEDITSVVNRQIRGVALYAGMAIPVRNFNAVMNAAVYEDEDGNWVPRTTVKQTLAKTMGTYGAKVVEGFVEDASEMSQRVDVTPVERIAGKLATNYVKAVLLGNLKVAMKQVASYPTAAAVIPWKYLNKALVAGGRNHRIISRADVDLINKYTPLYKMRQEGNANEIASITNKPGMEQKLPWLLGWITKMDVMTVGRLWSAAEYMVEDTHKDLTKGSDEFYREVAKVFNQTIQQTQPNFTPLQRSAALRSKNPIVRSLTLFGTQRMQNGGILIEAAMELKQSKGKSKKEIAAARAKLGRAVASQVVQNILLIAATFAVDALRGRMRGWQDDDDELTLESIGKKMGDTFLSNFLGSFLGGSEFYETISNMYKKANGQTTYDTEFSVPALDAIETIMSFGQSGIPNFINYLNGNHTDEEKLNKLKSFSMELAKVAGYATGLPLENAVKDVFKGIIPAIQDIRDYKKSNELIPWLRQSGKLDSATTRRRYEEWIDGGRKGSQFFALDKKLKGVSGGRDGRAAILREMDDLTPEDKAFLMEMYDNSEGYAEGSKFFNKNGKELYDFAAEPVPEAEAPAEVSEETPEAVPAEPEVEAAPDPFTEATSTVKKMNAEESVAYLNTTSFTSEEKYQILANADKNDPRAKNAEAFHSTYGLSYDDMWDVHTKYNSETFHGYDFQKYVDGKKGLKGRQKFALVEIANTNSAWLEKAQEINSKMGISYDTLWKIKLYWSGESGQGKKARITAYCKSLGLKQSQIDKLYDFRFLT